MTDSDSGPALALVATELAASSTSLGNIAFHQKCGFRPSAVRRD